MNKHGVPLVLTHPQIISNLLQYTVDLQTDFSENRVALDPLVDHDFPYEKMAIWWGENHGFEQTMEITFMGDEHDPEMVGSKQSMKI